MNNLRYIYDFWSVVPIELKNKFPDVKIVRFGSGVN